MSATDADDAWEREMEMAIAERGRTRSRSILATHTAEEEDEQPPVPLVADENSRHNRRTQSTERREVEVLDGGHNPNWIEELRSPIKDGSGTYGRNRTLSFSARKTKEMDEVDDTNYQSSRRRSCSFTSGDARNGHSRDGDGETSSEDIEKIVKRATSLSKIYLVGSAPVDVSKLQDSSKIVGVKKVEVKQPTGALSAQALDALSEGLQNTLLMTGKGEPPFSDAELTEEQLEEKKLEEEEDQKLQVEKMSTRKTLSARASLFKSKMFKPKSSARLISPPNKDGKAGTAAAATTGNASDKLQNELSPDIPVVPKKRHKLKLLLLGDSGVGKTSLMRVFSGDEFSESMLATAGVDFKLRHINIADEEIALQIWDTAGQERFHRITATYYKGAHGIVLVYDVSDKRGFDNVGYWMNNIKQYSSPSMLPAMLLVGNKIDLPNRVVSSEEGQATASQYHCRFIETSAKTSENTNGALETIARDMFLMSLNPAMTQKMLMEKEKSFVGRRNKENCAIQ